MNKYRNYNDDIIYTDEYEQHITAMTKEGLSSKSEIALELTHRDLLIDGAVYCLNAIIEYIEDYDKDTDNKVVISEIGEVVLRLKGEYLKACNTEG